MIGTMDRRSDGRLATAAARGDGRAFELLVERHFNAVYLTAYARLGDRESAEDLAQEVFLRSYLHLGQLDDPERFSHWVCRVARNLAEDWRRRRQTISRLLPMVPMEKGVEDLPGPSGDDVRTKLSRRQDEGAVRKAILALPPEQREIILLHYAEELSDREIAQRLGVHHTTVYYHRTRALDLFREQIGEWLGSEAPVLLPRRKTAARAAAVVAAAAAMSSEAKAALVSTSAATLPAQAATVVTSTSTSTAASGFWFPALLAKLKGFAFVGAIIVAKSKLITAGCMVIGLALTGGGVYYSAAGPGGWAAPGFTITPSRPGAKRERNPLLGRVVVPGVTAREVICGIYEITPQRLVEKTTLPERKWDVTMTGVYGDTKKIKRLAPSVIDQTFKINCRWGKKPMEALTLRRAPGIPLGLRAATQDKSSFDIEEGRVKAENTDLVPLQRRLEKVLNKPVVLDAALAGRFSYDVRWHPKKLNELNKHLRKQAGLELVAETRDVDVLVVESREGAQ